MKKFRLWLGLKLIALGSWVMGDTHEEEEAED